MSAHSSKPACFLGIGTGRCGTVSLAKIIGGCPGTIATHEATAYRSPWERPNRAALSRFIDEAREANDQGFVFGDVAFYWLPHLDTIREAIPDLRVICLKRDRAETVRSFLHKCPGFSLVRPQDRHFRPEWWDQMPTIDAPTVEEAWGRYWDYYYAVAAAIPGVLHLRTEDLEHDATLNQVFDHLRIPAHNRRYPENRRHNTAQETLITTPVYASSATAA